MELDWWLWGLLVGGSWVEGGSDCWLSMYGFSWVEGKRKYDNELGLEGKDY